PYCDRGRWLCSDAGWYWQSDYSWGWAPFHYGRWFDDPQFGWTWVPETTWSPAWVTWRSHDNIAGWAPLPPGADYVHGRGLVFHGKTVAASFDFGLKASHFTFLPFDRFGEHNPSLHAIPLEHVQNVFAESKVLNSFSMANDTVVNVGPSLDRI